MYLYLYVHAHMYIHTSERRGRQGSMPPYGVS